MSSGETVQQTDGAILGYVHSIETGGTVDGPGVRFVLFLSGCPIRCVYCHNPDTWPARAGQETTARAVVAELAGYAPFLKRAHGGLTLSGGEPLSQPAFAQAILRGAKTLGLHTAIDTSGFLGNRVDDAFLADVDLVLLDIKHIDPARHKALTGADNAPVLRFAERLATLGKPVWIRHVLLPGWTDDPDALARLAFYVAGLGNVRRVDVLPFHKMGEFKWREQALPYRLDDVEPPSPEAVEAARAIFRRRGLAVA